MKLKLEKDIFEYVIEWGKEFKAIIPVEFKDKDITTINPQVLVNYYPEREEFSFELFEEDELGVYDSEYILHTYMQEIIKNVIKLLVK